MNEMAKVTANAQKAAVQATSQLSRRTPRSARVNSAAASSANMVMSPPPSKKILAGSFVDSADFPQRGEARGLIGSARSSSGTAAIVPPLQFARANNLASARSHGILTPGMPLKKMKLQK